MKYYRKVIKNRIDSYVANSRILNDLGHNGVIGEIRESGLGKLFEELLPIDWGLGTGIIIDSDNRKSGQTDLIIYYKRVFPPIFHEYNRGIFPVESCGFAIEVKTKSNASEIKKTITNFNKIKSLENIKPPVPDIPEYRIKPIRVYFALSTDLTVKNELDRYKEQDENSGLNPAIQIICIVGKGIWIFYPPESSHLENKGIWRFYPNQGNHEEFVMLFSTIINQLISIVTLGGLNMKNYFFNDEEEFLLLYKGLMKDQ